LIAAASCSVRAEKDDDKVRELRQLRLWEERESYESDEIEFTRKLVRVARSLRVSVPARPFGDDDSEHWILSQTNGDWYLTESGIGQVRDAIRSEARWRREQRSHYLAWVSAITGLLGTLTGLIAVFWKLRSGT
jgi:hypothetical protein